MKWLLAAYEIKAWSDVAALAFYREFSPWQTSPLDDELSGVIRRIVERVLY